MSSCKRIGSWICTLAFIACKQQAVMAFVLPPSITHHQQLIAVASSVTDGSSNEVLTNPTDMRLREIQTELKERNVSYADCFDRESLVKRLVEARENNPIVSVMEKEDSAPQSTSSPSVPDTKATKNNDATNPSGDNAEFDRDATLSDLRELRVKVLKEKLSEYRVRWGTMIEKEDMVQALCNAMEQRFIQSQNFSRSGSLIPGEVTDATESILLQEMGWDPSDIQKGVATTSAGVDEKPHSPILLDVYATWCGPCKLVAPQLEAVAQELGPTCRILKIDSDKYPRLSSVLKISGLPTLIYFDGGSVSKEVKRVEGALMKDGILDLVNECRTLSS